MESQLSPAAPHGDAAYPNDFFRSHLAAQLAHQHAGTEAAALEALQFDAAIAGRLMSKGTLGTASTGLLQDVSGRITILISDEAAGKANHAAYASWRAGDIVGVVGMLCRLPSGELAMRAHELRRLVAATRPLPASVDAGEAHPARYVDLLTDDRARRMANLRSRLIRGIREFLVGRFYMEVETPLLHEAPAMESRQFSTHHNALDRKLYLRHAAEPHLKRLLIGGVDQVFEINRIFTNAGDGTACEETVLEIYSAYTNDSYMMALLEALLTRATRPKVLGDPVAPDVAPRVLNAPFARITVPEAIRKYAAADSTDAQLRDAASLAGLLQTHGIAPAGDAGWAGLQRRVFELIAAPRLTDPTFVAGFAADDTTRARRKTLDPQLAEYFELYIAGCRIAEGRSVLNDPEDPGLSVGDGGLDADYRRALEFGQPPASGMRLSIDRLVLVLARVAAASDTLLFPS